MPLLGAITIAAMLGCHARVPLPGRHAMGAIAGVPLLGAIVGAMAGCHCSVPLPDAGSSRWVPLLGAIARSHCLGANVRCHCWAPLLVCHCWAPWLDAIAGAIAACHCENPLREKLDQSVTPFSAALFSALITHKNWLVLSGVYAGIILFINCQKWGCSKLGASTTSRTHCRCNLWFAYFYAQNILVASLPMGARGVGRAGRES